MNRIFVEARIMFEVAGKWGDPSDQSDVDWLYQTLKDSTGIYSTEVGDFVSEGSVWVTDLAIYRIAKLERSSCAE